jgi:ADP-heptose:LPS heptosyltransferase
MDVLPEERRLVEAIEKESGGTVRLISAPPDFERYKAVLERMALLVTPDTGPMHIAAAIGTPLVALFSRKSPEDCGPFMPADKYRVLRAEDAPHPEFGLTAITPESVFDACTPFLADWQARGVRS